MLKPKAIIIGDITVQDEDDLHTVEFGILIRCANAEQVRQAMREKCIEFSVFEDEEMPS